MNWQPIETAPKDGGVLLGTWFSTWNQQSAIHIETVCFSFGKWIYAYDGDSCPQPPTHWMPIPPPPTQEPQE